MEKKSKIDVSFADELWPLYQMCIQFDLAISALNIAKQHFDMFVDHYLKEKRK